MVVNGVASFFTLPFLHDEASGARAYAVSIRFFVAGIVVRLQFDVAQTTDALQESLLHINAWLYVAHEMRDRF